MTSAHARLSQQQFFLKHAAGTDRFAEAPDIACPDIAALELAGQHRSPRHYNRRDVYTARTHHQGRSSLVTTTHQDDAIDRICANRLLHVHADEVSKQHGRWFHKGFAERHHRKLDGKTTGLINPALHRFRQLPKVRVTRRQLRPRIANADHRPSIKFMRRDTLILHPCPVDETVFAFFAKPILTAILCHCYFENLKVFYFFSISMTNVLILGSQDRQFVFSSLFPRH